MWFKFSVMECCGSGEVIKENFANLNVMQPKMVGAQAGGRGLKRYLSNDIV